MDDQLREFYDRTVAKIIEDMRQEGHDDKDAALIKEAAEKLEAALARFLHSRALLGEIRLLVANGSGRRIIEYNSSNPKGLVRYEDRNVIGAVSTTVIDGKRKILAGTIRGVTVIDDASSQVEANLRHHSMSQVNSISFAQVDDEPCLFVTGYAGQGNFIIRLRDPEHPVELGGTQPLGSVSGTVAKLAGKWRFFTANAFAAEGVIYEYGVELARAEAMKPERTYRGARRNISAIAVTAGKLYAGSDRMFRWTLGTERPEAEFGGSESPISAIEVAEVRGRRVVFAGTIKGAGPNRVYMWQDSDPAQPAAVWDKGADGTGKIRYHHSREGDCLIVGSANQLGVKTERGDICIFDLQQGLVSRLPGLPGINLHGAHTVSGIRDIAVIPQ